MRRRSTVVRSLLSSASAIFDAIQRLGELAPAVNTSSSSVPSHLSKPRRSELAPLLPVVNAHTNVSHLVDDFNGNFTYSNEHAP